MASPLGHSLAGAIVYKIFYPQEKKIAWPALLAIFFMANLPDLDFIPGLLAGSINKNHHGIIHSLGFILLVSPILALIFKKLLRRDFLKSFSLILTILAVHLLIDFLTLDLSPPAGGKFFWPFSHNFYAAPWPIFLPFWRDSWADVLTWKNLLSLLMEGGLLGGVLAFFNKKE